MKYLTNKIAQFKQWILSIVMCSNLTNEKFIKFFVILPIFFFGIHLGIIVAHIFSIFSFEIPFLFRITGIISGLYILLSIGFYIWLEENGKFITI